MRKEQFTLSARLRPVGPATQCDDNVYTVTTVDRAVRIAVRASGRKNELRQHAAFEGLSDDGSSQSGIGRNGRDRMEETC